MDKYIDHLTRFPIIPKPQNAVKNNLPYKQNQALKRLQNDDTIIFKEADKGGAIVIMDKIFYRDKILEQLNDQQYYQELPENMDKKTMRAIKKLVSKFSQCMTEKEIDYLTNFEVKTSNFYGLPKVHKSKQIEAAVQQQNSPFIEIQSPEDLKFRPIVAGPQCPTHRLSHFIDLILKPLCQYVPSFIRDDFDFLNHLPTDIDQDAILVSFDVVSLYTNIPHQLGLDSVNFWLEKYGQIVDQRFPSNFLIEALKIVLEHNTFNFNGKNYLQISGTAMGTKVAPTYATLVMGYLEDQMYQQVETRFDTEFKNYIKSEWKRFLDDCFLIFGKNHNLEEFHNLLNELHPSIKFTVESSDKELPFLDIMIIKTGKRIITDIFYKKTDTHQYLDFHSCHPSHTKRNIPFCLARRICTIVNDENRKELRLQELKTFLKKQNYPSSLIDMGIQKAKLIPLTELRSTRSKDQNTDLLPFVSTHNPNNPDMFSVIKNNLPVLHQNQNLENLFPSDIFLKSKRQPRNLKKILTRAKFQDSDVQNTVSKCNDSRCGLCEYLETGSQLILSNGKFITPNENINCKTVNLIYCLVCANCKEFYIGQTGNSICERVRIHRQQIRDESVRMQDVSEHFDICGGGKFKVFPFYKMKDSDESKRLAKESLFIRIFQPKLNR